MTKEVDSALGYIADVLADLHDHPPVNGVSALVHSTVALHMGATRYILLGETEKAIGLLHNFDISHKMKGAEVPR
jgi:hypothetical protein